jgi:hypothetical protein
MTKKYILKNTIKKLPEETGGVETYLAPPPPSQGKIIGLDCHPDSFTAAVFTGQTPHDARKLGSRENLGLEELLGWAKREFCPQDLFLLEAGSNSFEVCKRLGALGLNACVLESCHVGKHAKTYADNDKMAAARIALVYLQGNAPCVWIPDAATCERRELLHAYSKAVADHTAAGNALKGYLNQYTVRLGSRQQPEAAKTEAWLLGQRDWTPLQRELLADHLAHLRIQSARRKSLLRLLNLRPSPAPEAGIDGADEPSHRKPHHRRRYGPEAAAALVPLWEARKAIEGRAGKAIAHPFAY